MTGAPNLAELQIEGVAELSREIGAPVLLARGLPAASREEALLGMTEQLAAAGFIHDAGVVRDALLERERIAPTGLAPGVAVPHCRSEMVERLVVLIALLATPVLFDPPDGPPVERILLVVAPQGAATQYLEALGKISRLVRDRKALEALLGPQEGLPRRSH
jgi:mannitol/fructose-specific phosphotransferase system IIA component (Ntr-type)